MKSVKELEEINEITSKLSELGDLVRTEVIARSEGFGHSFPIHKISFGSRDPRSPTLGLIGGVHGLERIGAQVCLALFKSLSELALWDDTIQRTLQNIRIFFIPVVNPVGVVMKHRANPRGVDLMRNAPVEAEKPPWLLGGQRYSPRLPWFRGKVNEGMEIESLALINAIRREGFRSRCLVTVDFHSGFGLRDRLWFPYAKTVKPYPGLPYAHAFKSLLERTYPHHFYEVEPQAKNYTTHGDVWDFLYDEYSQHNGKGVYLPLCLEMGSWLWVKKNPLQLLSMDGPFNPIKQHRQRRILRRHNTLFDFLIRAVASPDVWCSLRPEQLNKHEQQAKQAWYGT